MKPPLTGLRVLAFEQAVAAPLATRHLADLGADVIKIERRDGGDFARSYDRAFGDLSSFFVWLNRGKRSLTLDLKAPGSSEVLAHLLGSADLVVHNFGPGAARRLGIDAETLASTHPQILVGSVNGYGSDGPWRDRKAYDLLVQAEAGLLSLTGDEKTMAKVPVSVADIAAGMHLFAGLLLSLLTRSKLGGNVPIEISLFDAMVDWMGAPLLFTMGTGTQPARSGTHHATIAPYGSYETADGGQVMLAVQNDREWERFCREFLERPELTSDPRFASNSDRVANRAALDSLIGEATGRQSAPQLIHSLEEAGIGAARLNSVGDLANHVVLTERQRWRPATLPAGEVKTLRSPFDAARASSWFERRAGKVPELGEHTEVVLAEMGCSPEEIARWSREGVI